MSGNFEQAKSSFCQSEGAYVTMRPSLHLGNSVSSGSYIDPYLKRTI